MEGKCLDDKRNICEVGNGKDVGKVVPGLLAPRGANREAGAPAYRDDAPSGGGHTRRQGYLEKFKSVQHHWTQGSFRDRIEKGLSV